MEKAIHVFTCEENDKFKQIYISFHELLHGVFVVLTILQLIGFAHFYRILKTLPMSTIEASRNSRVTRGAASSPADDIEPLIISSQN